MKVVVTGATGNVGTSVVAALTADDRVDEVVAVARRVPVEIPQEMRFVGADVAESDLVAIFRGADVVVHLAWLIQPGRDESVTRRVNVRGSERVFDSVVAAGVPALVYASSVGAYSPGPKDRFVDESWPTAGVDSSFYSRHKAAVERSLDRLEREQPQLRVVRLRPGLIFKRSAASEIRRLFAGPFLPRWALRASLVPLTPDVPGLRFQAVHADDVGDAYRQAVLSDATGAFNIAADPPIGTQELVDLLSAAPRRVSASLLRRATAVTFAMRLHPVEPGWFDMALAVPLMSTDRAREELGWKPTRTATETIRELMIGMREGADAPTPPLSAATSGPARIRELITGLGQRQ